MANNQKILVVIGGGAAGFFCAINAAIHQPDLKIILLEKTAKLLSKVKISGGGRCNVTNACFSISEMSKKYPRGEKFVKKAFHQFFTSDTINWFEARNVPLKAEQDGRMFPVTDDSQTIIDCLLSEAVKYRVDIKMKTEVQVIKQSNNGFELELNNHQTLKADYVTIACGGFPKTSMFDWLIKTGHAIEEPVQSLFTFNIPNHPIVQLMGISVKEANVKINGTKLKENGPVLITHWGLSGPAILRLSAWGARELQQRNWNFTTQINWLPAFNEETLKDEILIQRKTLASQKIYNKNPFGLPSRLWEFICGQTSIDENMRLAELPAKEQNKLIKNLCAYELEVKGKTTYKEEFVTAGGILLSEIDSNTMMSKLIPNLFFAGEILNVDGITGGFNFQNAWTTGFIAAKNIGK